MHAPNFLGTKKVRGPNEIGDHFSYGPQKKKKKKKKKEVNCVKKGPWPFLVLKVLKQGQTGDLCITLASSTLTPPSESGH